MELEVTPVAGQGVAYEVNPVANFTMDSIAPMLIGMDVDTFDPSMLHRRQRSILFSAIAPRSHTMPMHTFGGHGLMMRTWTVQ